MNFKIDNNFKIIKTIKTITEQVKTRMDYYCELAQEKYDSVNKLEFIKYFIHNASVRNFINLRGKYPNQSDLINIFENISTQQIGDLYELPIYNCIFNSDWNDIFRKSKDLWINGGLELIINPIIQLQAIFRRRVVIQNRVRV